MVLKGMVKMAKINSPADLPESRASVLLAMYKEAPAIIKMTVRITKSKKTISQYLCNKLVLMFSSSRINFVITKRTAIETKTKALANKPKVLVTKAACPPARTCSPSDDNVIMGLFSAVERKPIA
jgi:hypothetical protein